MPTRGGAANHHACCGGSSMQDGPARLRAKDRHATPRRSRRDHTKRRRSPSKSTTYTVLIPKRRDALEQRQQLNVLRGGRTRRRATPAPEVRVTAIVIISGQCCIQPNLFVRPKPACCFAQHPTVAKPSVDRRRWALRRPYRSNHTQYTRSVVGVPEDPRCIVQLKPSLKRTAMFACWSLRTSAGRVAHCSRFPMSLPRTRRHWEPS